MVTTTHGFLPRADFDRLIGVLGRDGRHVIGPTVADGAIVHDEIRSTAELPVGTTARAAPGVYRLQPTGRERVEVRARG